jgi:hypothetical protein
MISGVNWLSQKRGPLQKCDRERENGRYEVAERNSDQGRGPVNSPLEVGFTKSLMSLWDRIQSKAVVDPDYAAAASGHRNAN